jgi:rieske iron-sulfur protein
MTKTFVSRRELGLLAAASVALPGTGPADNALSPQPGDTLVAVADSGHTALRSDAIVRGAAPILAWPMDRQTGLVRDGARANQVLLLRVPDGQADRLAAFSAICSHAGCLVSGWVAETGRLRCQCHDSEFDPTHDGAVLAGPSAYPLPELPVQIADGLVVVAGPFSARPGGHATRTM